jgi:Protein of unknown function (DUF3631)
MDIDASPLDSAREFVGKILYAPPYALDALTLFCASSHALDAWDTVPRSLAVAPKGQAGKSTLMNIIRMLGQNTWSATGATSFALRSKFNEPVPPLVLIDEVSNVFGNSGMVNSNSQIALIARDGYTSFATLSLSVGRVTEDVSSFCYMAMAGLKIAVPADIRSRCIVFNMRPRPESYRLEYQSTDPDTRAIGVTFNRSLHQWVRNNLKQIKQIKRTFRSPHAKFSDRLAEIWTPLYVTALAAGGDWPERCMTAFKAMALDASDQPVLLPEQAMLRDAAEAVQFYGKDKVFASEILVYLREHLHSEDESGSLWDTLKDRAIAKIMTAALGPTQVIRQGQQVGRGYEAAPILAAWRELDAKLTAEQAPPPAPDEYDEMFTVQEDDNPQLQAVV